MTYVTSRPGARRDLTGVVAMFKRDTGWIFAAIAVGVLGLGGVILAAIGIGAIV